MGQVTSYDVNLVEKQHHDLQQKLTAPGRHLDSEVMVPNELLGDLLAMSSVLHDIPRIVNVLNQEGRSAETPPPPPPQTVRADRDCTTAARIHLRPVLDTSTYGSCTQRTGRRHCMGLDILDANECHFFDSG